MSGIERGQAELREGEADEAGDALRTRDETGVRAASGFQRVPGRLRGRAPDLGFDPLPLRDVLLPLLRAIEAVPDTVSDPLPADRIDPLLRLHPRPGGGFFSRSELIAGFRAFAHDVDFRFDEARFRRRVQRRPVRTQSGVTPLTVLTKPFPCPGQCIFCPNDVRMPKSYLSDEPGAQRAANNRFDPYRQTWNRLAAFDATGHPVFPGDAPPFSPVSLDRRARSPLNQPFPFLLIQALEVVIRNKPLWAAPFY